AGDAVDPTVERGAVHAAGGEVPPAGAGAVVDEVVLDRGADGRRPPDGEHRLRHGNDGVPVAVHHVAGRVVAVEVGDRRGVRQRGRARVAAEPGGTEAGGARARSAKSWMPETATHPSTRGVRGRRVPGVGLVPTPTR